MPRCCCCCCCGDGTALNRRLCCCGCRCRSLARRRPLPPASPVAASRPASTTVIGAWRRRGRAAVPSPRDGTSLNLAKGDHNGQTAAATAESSGHAAACARCTAAAAAFAEASAVAQPRCALLCRWLDGRPAPLHRETHLAGARSCAGWHRQTCNPAPRLTAPAAQCLERERLNGAAHALSVSWPEGCPSEPRPTLSLLSNATPASADVRHWPVTVGCEAGIACA